MDDKLKLFEVALKAITALCAAALATIKFIMLMGKLMPESKDNDTDMDDDFCFTE